MLKMPRRPEMAKLVMLLPISSHDPSSVTRKKNESAKKSERVDAMMKREKGGRRSRWLRTEVTAERATKGVRSLKRSNAACRMMCERAYQSPRASLTIGNGAKTGMRR